MEARVLADSLERLRRLGSVVGNTKEVHKALSAVRQLLADASVDYRIVGGIAVHHHGFRRYTEDVAIIIDGRHGPQLDAHLSQHGFSRERPDRLRHLDTNVVVDLLIGGAPVPRRPGVSYPMPEDVEPSPHDPHIAALGPLLRLKLLAGRRIDEADVVELLKLVDDARYLHLEDALDAALRPSLAELRDTALEELRWKQEEQGELP